MEDKFATNARFRRHPTIPKKFEMRVTYLGDDRVASMVLDKVMYYT